MFVRLSPLLALLFLAGCGNEDLPAVETGSDTGTDSTTTTDTTPPGDTTTGDVITTDATPDTTTTDTITTLPEPDNHRPEEVVCDNERPATEYLPGPDDGEWPCMVDADCTEGENGRCSAMPRWGWECTYDLCFEDSDCGDSVCGCNGHWGSDANVCRAGDCQVNADCGEGGWCSPTYDDCGNYSGVTAYYCHTPEDECVNDSDCTEEFDGYCMFNSAVEHWVCSYSHCVGK